jgi:Fe-S oxidoreductase
LNEKNGPRGRAVMLKNNFSDTSFYNCTLCKACKVECPADVDLELNKVRENLVKKGVETEANKKMIENIRKYGNPFGKLEKGKIPKDLYCC